eukprot:s555_g1.t3
MLVVVVIRDLTKACLSGAPSSVSLKMWIDRRIGGEIATWRKDGRAREVSIGLRTDHGEEADAANSIEEAAAEALLEVPSWDLQSPEKNLVASCWACYFGSKKYFEGHRFEHPSYEHLDALQIKDKKNGIIMSSFAIDVRQNAGQVGLGPGDQVLWHYTNEEAFRKITNLENQLQLLASRDLLKDISFDPGCYATKKAPHEWDSKEHLTINNFLPNDKKIEELRGETLREGESLEDLAGGKVGKYVVEEHGDKADYGIAIIVDRQVAKNVMKEDTDVPATPNGYSDGQWEVKGAEQNERNNLDRSARHVQELGALLRPQVQDDMNVFRSRGLLYVFALFVFAMLFFFPLCFCTCLVLVNMMQPQNGARSGLLKIIEFDNGCAAAYNNLGELLKPDEEIQVQLLDGPRNFSQRELFLEAIELDNGFAVAYNNLGKLLKPGEEIQVQLRDGLRSFSQKQLFLKAIELDNGFAAAYSNLGMLLKPGEEIQVQLRDGPRNFSQRELYLKAIELDNGFAAAYSNLGMSLKPGEEIQVQLRDGPRNFSQRELFLKAIELDNGFEAAYHNLGKLLKPDEEIQVQLRDGPRNFCQSELFLTAKKLGNLKAIELDNGFAAAYNNLGMSLKPGEEIQVQLRDGPRNFSQRELYLEAIELDNGFAAAYSNLGMSLKPGEEIQVQMRDGPRNFSQRELFLKAIELDNGFAAAYNNLGMSLKPGEKIQVQLRDGPRTCSQSGLSLKAIALDNGFAAAYNNLGMSLKPGEKIQVQLRDGPRIFSQRGLFLKAIELDNGFAAAYNNLGMSLKPGEEIQVQLRDGPRNFSQRELFLKAIELDNGFAAAYNNLGKLLKPDEDIQVQLRDGLGNFSQRELCLKAIELDNGFEAAYSNLGMSLKPGEDIQVRLRDGLRIFSKTELLGRTAEFGIEGDEVGKARHSCYNLPPDGHAYGRVFPRDPEGWNLVEWGLVGLQSLGNTIG